MGAHAESIALVKVAAHAASEKLAENMVALDVADRLGVTDAFLIVSGGSEPQVNAIVDEIVAEVLDKYSMRPIRREGFGLGRWVLLDYGDVVVHVQHQEDRIFYALERLWADCPVIELPAENPENQK
ncbi:MULTISPECIES: ribosome silencing factor [Glutamicibacter]|jgi:ribosome-associated protein|uniref:Ribosomal silencing factor RsfS n=2 Tax=Glutamicibacter TaxID=1742989 RepID=A0ABQ0RGA0_GLUNI|nr:MULTISPECIES: ribosome silencing factor [Glutamicibacter]MCZ4148782.1 ribosome silencing factor [Escherichia coli]MBM7768627.1 ribosome-associated protein [Glutamicibacter nicotianae]QEP07376.1 ribosome silencing factor [Glutamicibacter sp. ZJUTW]UTM47136.1 ribosome silencing factor [Glutamicibacter mysorens]GEC10840.1 ribosomal silencing factor RsfS [Glutamicibacter nicotianae]